MLFADTSFLCSLLRNDEHTGAADACRQRYLEPLAVSDWVVLEFEHAARLQTFRFLHDRTQGYSRGETERLLTTLLENISNGIFQVHPVDWAEVLAKASELSAAYTTRNGHRLTDTLHVATALRLQADFFLTFDSNQASLARHVGLRVLP